MMTFPGLDQPQSFALIFELDNTRYLLRHAYLAVSETQFVDITREPILTTLSIGVEKTLKLCLGAAAVAQDGVWPSKRKMQNEFGHGSEAMWLDLRALFEQAASEKPYLTELLEDLDADPVWPLLLAVLDAYGRSGRFHYLDTLADAAPKYVSPADQWDSMLRVAAAQDPSIESMQLRGDYDEAERAIQAVVAATLRRWWFLVHRCLINDAIGPLGKQVGWDLEPRSVLALRG